MTNSKLIRYLLGEADDLRTTDDAPPPRVDAGDAPPQSSPTPVTPEDEDVEGNTVVNELASAWQSGSKMDVASRLMYSPVSYTDFVRVLYMIGQDGALELGSLLDELSAGDDTEPDVSPLVRQAAGEPPADAEPAEPTEPAIPDEAEEQRP